MPDASRAAARRLRVVAGTRSRSTPARLSVCSARPAGRSATGTATAFVDAQGGVEQGEGLLAGQGGEALAAHAGEFGPRQGAAHARLGLPHAPGHGHGGQPLGAAGGGERVEGGVGGGVGGLAGRAEDAGDGRVQHEGVQGVPGRQLVQVPGRVGLGGQHAGQALAR